jgi:hypothetical protein
MACNTLMASLSDMPARPIRRRSRCMLTAVNAHVDVVVVYENVPGYRLAQYAIQRLMPSTELGALVVRA